MAQASFETTMLRAGIDCDPQIHLEEWIIPSGQNSNLIQRIEGQATRFRGLLYAWRGLRTLSAEVKKKFDKKFEADSTASVVALFKRALLGK